ncbi:unnamed protein product [Calypogeia fissa]
MAVVSSVTTMSRATLVSASSISLIDGCVCSSSSSAPISAAVCFRNDNAARFGRATLSLSFKKEDVESGFVISRRSRVGFVKLGGFDEKRRRWGAVVVASASVSADVGAVVEEGEEAGAKKSEEKELLAQLLSLVEGSDCGAQFGKEEHAKVGELVVQLEKYCIPDPLQSPLVFGGWDVKYSSNQMSSGGGYRTWIGRRIFRTSEMFQVFDVPDGVSNFVRFLLFGLIPGAVQLRGKSKPEDNKTTTLNYEPPFFELGPLKFQYGKTSSATIAVIYVDDTVKIARGVRGTVFVFTKR